MNTKYLYLAAPLPLLAMLMLGADAIPSGNRTTATPIAAEATGRVRAEGRVATYPGGDVTISSEVSGRIIGLDVREKSAVTRGAALVRLDATEQRAALGVARAAVGEARTVLEYHERDFTRKETLWSDQVVSDDTMDQARRERDLARARVATAEATVEQLASIVDKTTIVSPLTGVVLERFVEPGEMVQPGDPLFRLADLSRLRIEAEVDEFDAHRVRPGTPVRIAAEGETEVWNGTVEEVPDAVTGRRFRPQDPGRPTDTGVLLVKIAILDPTPLKLGQRVEVEIQ